MNPIPRLEFKSVFPEEEPLDIKVYLNKISSNTLLNVIGFSNTIPQPNFDNFNSNLEIRQDIVRRVNTYLRMSKITEKPGIVTRLGSLKLAEIVLSNRVELIENNTNPEDIDIDEINMLKAFLIINHDLNTSQIVEERDDSFELMVDIIIASSFPASDLGFRNDNNLEFVKLVHATIIRFEYLIEFLEGSKKYKFLGDELCKYFNQDNSKKLVRQVKLFFVKLLEIKMENGFRFLMEDDAKPFVESLVSYEVAEDEDFTNLKNYPIYKIDKSTYAIIDFFFAVDKFVKSTKFILKSAFHEHLNLPAKDRSFFEFYNTEFTEKFLVVKLLDKLFHKKHFKKKEQNKGNKHEPDYYIRHGNTIFLFENKDVLIAKNVKSSGNISLIEKTLKLKFLEVNENPIGIGQLITSIEQILLNKFNYDQYVNSKKNFKVYPILLLNDRIFETPGLNYRMNTWYKESIKERLKENYNPNYIKDLIILDIDTLIYWLPYLTLRDNNFKDILDLQIKIMKPFKKINITDPIKAKEAFQKKIGEQLSPISSRYEDFKFLTSFLIDNIKREL
ncbi:hypothetical protein ACXR6G_16840 [Ancylomarina sp. YFZ004]